MGTGSEETRSTNNKIEMKICATCKQKKKITEFRTRKNKISLKIYTINTCTKCENEQQRIRNSTPERKAYIKEKHQSVKYKNKQLEYQKTERYKERIFNYNRTEKVIERRNVFEKSESRILYLQEYSKRDYVKERVKNYSNSEACKSRIKKYLETEAGKLSTKRRQETWLNSDKRMIQLLNKQFGVEKKLITHDLIELKRITLKTTRLCRQLKN